MLRGVGAVEKGGGPGPSGTPALAVCPGRSRPSEGGTAPFIGLPGETFSDSPKFAESDNRVGSDRLTPTARGGNTRGLGEATRGRVAPERADVRWTHDVSALRRRHRRRCRRTIVTCPLDELEASTDRLVAAHPEVEVWRAGTSRGGHELRCLEIGDGPLRAVARRRAAPRGAGRHARPRVSAAAARRDRPRRAAGLPLLGRQGHRPGRHAAQRALVRRARRHRRLPAAPVSAAVRRPVRVDLPVRVQALRLLEASARGARRHGGRRPRAARLLHEPAQRARQRGLLLRHARRPGAERRPHRGPGRRRAAAAPRRARDALPERVPRRDLRGLRPDATTTSTSSATASSLPPRCRAATRATPTRRRRGTASRSSPRSRTSRVRRSADPSPAGISRGEAVLQGIEMEREHGALAPRAVRRGGRASSAANRPGSGRCTPI